MLAVQKAVHEDNTIGEIRCIYTDHSMDAYGKRPDTDRVLSAQSAGGALLDVGPYPMVWVSTGIYGWGLIVHPGFDDPLSTS